MGEDLNVNLLQNTFAKMVGKEKALFVPLGTMGNLISVLTFKSLSKKEVQKLLLVTFSEKNTQVALCEVILSEKSGILTWYCSPYFNAHTHEILSFCLVFVIC